MLVREFVVGMSSSNVNLLRKTCHVVFCVASFVSYWDSSDKFCSVVPGNSYKKESPNQIPSTSTVYGHGFLLGSTRGPAGHFVYYLLNGTLCLVSNFCIKQTVGYETKLLSAMS